MRIHILGICGTFMAGLAVLARQLGHEVTGCDQNVYPPMSSALEAAGIQLTEGYHPDQLPTQCDQVIIGNALSRGNPIVEAVLNRQLPYTSGPEWLSRHVLQNRQVIAVSGTHGKTTTSSLLAWILTQAGVAPGYLIGGVAQNFETTAALGTGKPFVMEADEYDTAFFDKRSKFLHYRPNILIMNNLEYDHADIFENLEAIKRQFQFLLRTVPGKGCVIYPDRNEEIKSVLARGCWSATETFGLKTGVWRAQRVTTDGSTFDLWHRDQKVGTVSWGLLGQHNVMNALAASAAAFEAGVKLPDILKGLQSFQGVKRRLEVLDKVNGITVYDDFAHHPSAIAATLTGLRAHIGDARLVAVLQFGSNTMKQGVHQSVLAKALQSADRVALLQPGEQACDAQTVCLTLGPRAKAYVSVQDIVNDLSIQLRPNDHVVIMSNRSFDGLHQKLLARLRIP